MTPEQFHAHTERRGACLEWTGPRSPSGYGKLYFRGKMMMAPRVAWVLAHGGIPPGLHVCHTCDNPPCVDPLHLFVGTNDDNQRDRRAKGRTRLSAQRGVLNPATHLTELDVLDIRRLTAEGWSNQQLAQRYGVVHQTISRIVQRKRWGHL